MSHLEDTLARQLTQAGLPTPEREHRFAPPRKWRLDFAWPEHRIAIEVDGGTYSGGRHTRGKGFEADCEKTNTATLQGWLLLRVTGAMVRDGRALRTAEKAMEQATRGQAT
jgi:very-short-patch-repair endonuclease